MLMVSAHLAELPLTTSPQLNHARSMAVCNILWEDAPSAPLTILFFTIHANYPIVSYQKMENALNVILITFSDLMANASPRMNFARKWTSTVPALNVWILTSTHKNSKNASKKLLDANTTIKTTALPAINPSPMNLEDA